MNSVSGSARMTRIRLLSSNENSEQSTSCTTISHLCVPRSSSASLPTQNADNRKKRRKVEKSVPLGLQAVQLFDDKKSIVLTRFDLDLLPLAPPVDDDKDDGLSQDAVLSLENFNRSGPETFSAILWSTSTPTTGVEIFATTPSDTLDSITARAQNTGRLSTTMHGQKRVSREAACFSRCVLHPLSASSKAFRLTVEIRWLVGLPTVEFFGPSSPSSKRDLYILAQYIDSVTPKGQELWSLTEFYNAVHVPAVNLPIAPPIENSFMITKLRRFQQRSVDWLLRREGVSFSANGTLEAIPQSSPPLPLTFHQTRDASGRPCFVSLARGMAIFDPSSARDTSHLLKGGILAEEMGLGKTVELIALIQHHKRRDLGGLKADGQLLDPRSGLSITPSKATLIITPPSILHQWINEIDHHAPHLTVYHYRGLPASHSSKARKDEGTVENLIHFDVVLTTYEVLSREIHFARPVPERQFRSEKVHKARRSPLVEISWWRVCLDEAQMVENGVSQAAVVAELIPRCNAWAVTGTPLRKDAEDLRGLLIFLRYGPAVSKRLWARLDKVSFHAMFNQITLRHTKDAVRDELRIPHQKRVIVTVPFTAIEQQHYLDMFRHMCKVCEFSADGEMLEDIDPKKRISQMSDWLVRLRQTCLHAHVGQKNRAEFGAKDGPPRNIREQLGIMEEQNDAAIKAEARGDILAQLACGHITANAGNDDHRAEKAEVLYAKAHSVASDYVESCRAELALEEATAAATPAGRPNVTDDLDDEDLNRTGSSSRVLAVRKALRSFLELRHRCSFFIAITFAPRIESMQSNETADAHDLAVLQKRENDWFDDAKRIRDELLLEVRVRTQRRIANMRLDEKACPIPHLEHTTDGNALNGEPLTHTLEKLIDILNDQADQIHEWRTEVISILRTPLLDTSGTENTGEEYEESMKIQDRLYVYVMALKTLVADRNALVNGQRDVEGVERDWKFAEKEAQDGKGHAPDLLLELVRARKKHLPNEVHGSLRSVASRIRSMLLSLQGRVGEGEADGPSAQKLAIIQRLFDHTHSSFTDQDTALSEMTKEQEMFRGMMNQRLEFYRQLQDISDGVRPWREKLDETFDDAAFARQSRDLVFHQQKMNNLKLRRGYLTHLRNESSDNSEQTCLICLQSFEIGTLTSCGHRFHTECIRQWWKEKRNCPLCKTKLRDRNLRDIDFRSDDVQAQEQSHVSKNAPPASSSSSRTSIYSSLPDSIMREIKNVELNDSYGTKVDSIAKHLIWIRHNDVGAKSIVFSQFGDFLGVLRSALTQWKIGVCGIRDKGGIQKFRNDPGVDCFLLDAKSDSSGLNLVNATYVFLCEPLINPAIELQAIARVHRIGQERPTTVVMYIVSDTVEEAIYDISVARRLEHMKDNEGEEVQGGKGAVAEATLDAANSMEIEAAPMKKLLQGKGLGEAVKSEDLRSCLFSKVPKRTLANVVQVDEPAIWTVAQGMRK